MFATLVGGYPRTPLPGRPFRLRTAHAALERGEIDAAGYRAAQDELIDELLREQMDAGLGLVTDGQVRWDDPQTAMARGLSGFEVTGLLRYFDTNTYYRQPRAVSEPRWVAPITVADWQFTDAAARRQAAERGLEPVPAKQALVGPYTLGRLSDPGDVGRQRLTLALAEALNQELRALAQAGTPVIQVDENAFTLIGSDDDAERELARDALSRLTDGLEGSHLCLAVTMGSAAAAGSRLFYDAPFSSYMFDLVSGRDGWRVVADAPEDRGIVCGVADARNTAPDEEAVMVAAARYAAALSGRGLDRVGLAPSASLEYLPRDRAKAKIEALGAAARLAALTDDAELRAILDSPVPGGPTAGAHAPTAADRHTEPASSGARSLWAGSGTAGASPVGSAPEPESAGGS